MVNPTIKKLRNEIVELKKSVDYQRNLKEGYQTELREVKEKLEVQSSRLEEALHAKRVYEGNLQDQVKWLRQLVEQLTVSPEKTNAIAKAKVLEEEQHRIDEKIHRNMMREDRIENYAKHPYMGVDFGISPKMR